MQKYIVHSMLILLLQISSSAFGINIFPKSKEDKKGQSPNKHTNGVKKEHITNAAQMTEVLKKHMEELQRRKAAMKANEQAALKVQS